MKAPVNQAAVARAHINSARVSGIDLGADSGKAFVPSFHPSLVDYWNFKAKSNSDPDRDMIKGVKGGVLAAYNFGWSLNSGYGEYGTDFKTQWNSYDSSYGSIIDSRTAHTGKVGSWLYVIAYGNRKAFADSFQGRITGMPEGYSLYIGYAGNLHLVTSENGGFIVNKSDIPGDVVPQGQSIVVNGGFKIMKTGNPDGNKEVPCDVTIELMPDYPGAIVSDGIDDYLEFDKTGYRIGTVICRYSVIAGDDYTAVFYVGDELKYVSVGFNNFDSAKRIGDYLVYRNDTPSAVNSSMTIDMGMGGSYLAMALYDIAIYEDSLTDTEIEKEIIKMQSL